VTPDDAVPAAVRAHWLSTTYPKATVVQVHAPLDPNANAADFPKRFAAFVRPHLKGPIEALFASELPYRACAAELRAEFVAVDPQRVAVPVSGTAIRANVMEHFHHVAPIARPWIVRRVAVVGAESSGKSTLCAQLRDKLGAMIVPEYLRTLAMTLDTLDPQMIQMAARCQIASEDALASQVPGGAGGGLLVCDTELTTIDLWARRLFVSENYPTWIADTAKDRAYDLYLLCKPDLRFVGPPERDHPADRLAFHAELEKRLEGQPVVAIEGTREERLTAACDAVIALFSPTQLLGRRALAHG
jgi:NadR type nicotinamide-nucleotide adenylyltransferase